MKYPTGEYRKLLCLYQQLQQPEPVIFSRSLREHHLLFLSNTPKLILYFTRQGKRYWLINAKDCLGLKAFRLPAGTPGQFFTRPLKNTLSVKLHRVLDNNEQAISIFQQAVTREVCRVFDSLIKYFHQPSYSTFMFHRSATVHSGMLARPPYTGVLGYDENECRVVLTLRRSGLGQLTIDMILYYSPLPFVRYHTACQVEGVSIELRLSDEIQSSLKAQLCQQVPLLVGTFFHRQ